MTRTRLLHPESAGPRAGLASALLLSLASAPAHAYIDPGTGSILLQSLLAGIAVAVGVLRTYWERIKAFLSPGRAAARDSGSGSALPQQPSDAEGER